MMRPSRSAAAPPASLTSPKSCATKRQRKAAPLGDVTNLLVLAETPTPSKPRRTACRSLPAPSDVSAVSSACSSSASAAPAPKHSAAASATPGPKPSSAASVTPARKPSSSASAAPAPKPSAACVVTPAPKPKPSSAAVIQEERGVVKSPITSTVYRRTTETQGRWRNPAAANSKGKEPVAATARCPPLGKSARTNSRKKDTQPISASASCHEGKKKQSIASAPNLLEDLLEKQRAYFADFDAFELVEEDTNLLVVAETPTPSKPRRTAHWSLPAPSDISVVSSACSSSASVTPVPKPSGAASVTPARKLSPAACVTPAPKPSSAACVVTPAPKPSSAAVLEERSVLKSPTISTVHRRTTEAQGRWRRNPATANSKGKEPVAATARCPPLGKSARTNSRKKDTRPISASAPCHEGKKLQQHISKKLESGTWSFGHFRDQTSQKRSIASTPNLLEDILEKQRAYFADIDAFELVEEEASESELE